MNKEAEMVERSWRAGAVSLALVLGLVGCKDRAKPQVEAPKETANNTVATTVPTATTATATTGAVKAPEEADQIPTKGAMVKVVPLQHGSLRLEFGDKTIYVDPTSKALGDGEVPRGQLVLVTHIHGDHLDPAAIKRVRAEGAEVIAPASVAEKAGEALPGPRVMGNGESAQFLEGVVKVEAVAMYNLERKRENGEFFHPKGRGNGYVLTIDGARIFISGDTECVPEIEALEGIDAAFLCMNLPYTMPIKEAGACALKFKPKRLFPYHYRGQEPGKLEAQLAGSGIELRLLQWYPES